MNRSRSVARPNLDDSGETLLDWMELRQREIGIALLAVFLVAAAGWLFLRWRGARAEGGARALATAQDAYNAGNAPLARSELTKVISRFSGTPAANEAGILLAQSYYADAKFNEGIKALQPLVSSSDALTAANAENLIAAGYEQLGRYAEAATHYEQAGKRATYQTERDGYLASAARAYTAAEQPAAAERIWRTLSQDKTSDVAAEARVRLGEIEAAGKH